MRWQNFRERERERNKSSEKRDKTQLYWISKLNWLNVMESTYLDGIYYVDFCTA